MNHALDLLLLAVTAGGVAISLFISAKAFKPYGTPVLPEAACRIGSSVLLFLSLWLPFHRHSTTGGGIDGNLASAALVLFYLPDAFRWLQRRRKQNHQRFTQTDSLEPPRQTP